MVSRYVLVIPLITLIIALASIGVLMTLLVLWIRDRRRKRAA